MRTFVLGLGLGLFTSLTAFAQVLSPEDRSPGVVKVLKGVTECREPDADDAPCGIEYWSMYVHADGSRYMHVMADNHRAGEARHAMIRVDSDGETQEAFMNNWSKDGVLGSAYAVRREAHVDVAVSDTNLPRSDDGLYTEEVEAFDQLDSLATGPASADGLHFLTFDFDKPEDQPHGVYWFGGSRHDTMVGNIVTSEYTYIGEADMTLKDGTELTADHFRMLSGTEVWLTKEDRALVRMDLKFGYESTWELTSLEIIEPGR